MHEIFDCNYPVSIRRNLAFGVHRKDHERFDDQLSVFRMRDPVQHGLHGQREFQLARSHLTHDSIKQLSKIFTSPAAPGTHTHTHTYFLRQTLRQEFAVDDDAATLQNGITQLVGEQLLS